MAISLLISCAVDNSLKKTESKKSSEQESKTTQNSLKKPSSPFILTDKPQTVCLQRLKPLPDN